MSGINVQHELAPFPDADISTEDIFGEEDFSDLYKIAARPAFVQTYTFDSTYTPGKIIGKFAITPTCCGTFNNAGTFTTFLTPMALVAYNFKHWRGGIKVCLEVVASQLQEFTLRVSQHPTLGEIPVSFTDGGGDYPSRNIKCKGDTWICFTIPYQNNFFWSKVLDPDNKAAVGAPGGIALSVNMPLVSASPTGANSVSINLWVAAGKSFRCQTPISRVNTRHISYPASTAALGTFVSQVSVGDNMIEDLFMQEFDPLIEGTDYVQELMCAPRQPMGVRDLLHRFEIFAFSQTIGNTWNNYTNTAGPSNNLVDTSYNLFSSYFIGVRGGFNYKIVRSNDVNNTDGVLICELNEYNSGTAVSPAVHSVPGKSGRIFEDLHYKPSLEFHVPYSSLFTYNCLYSGDQFSDEYLENGFGLFFNSRGTLSGTTVVDIFVACDDSYSMGLPACAPAIVYTVTQPGAVVAPSPRQGSKDNNNKVFNRLSLKSDKFF